MKYYIANQCFRRRLPRTSAFARYFSSKERVVVLGCGWGGFRFAQDIDKDKYDVVLISPRNHFLFTPLLPSTAVGTLEFRCIQEPVRTIPGVHYIQASCTEVNIHDRKVICKEIFKQRSFTEKFDRLVFAVGSETNTLGVPGVQNNSRVFFLKQLEHARSIRLKMIECFERASTPFIDQTERKRLLTFVVVGGGPTNVEFASELHDFLRKDVAKWYPDLHDHVRVVVIEASGHILGSFNESLVEYVEKLFASRNIEVFTKTVVKEVKENVAVLGDGKELPFGVMVWSTGIKQMDLVRNMPDEVCRSQGGRLQVDEHLRLQGEDGKGGITPLGEGTVFAIGDCAGDISRPLPALAQVASQQGKYLAHFLNNHKEEASKDIPNAPPFKYAHLGSMASVGEWKGVIDASDIDKSSKDPAKLKGFLAFALWRAAYWTKQVSFTNKLLIPMYWFKSAVFGRDISRF